MKAFDDKEAFLLPCDVEGCPDTIDCSISVGGVDPLLARLQDGGTCDVCNILVCKRHSQGHKVINANKDSWLYCPGVCDDARLFRFGLERIPFTGACSSDRTMARAEVILSRNRTRLEIFGYPIPKPNREGAVVTDDQAADKDRAAAEEIVSVVRKRTSLSSAFDDKEAFLLPCDVEGCPDTIDCSISIGGVDPLLARCLMSARGLDPYNLARLQAGGTCDVCNILVCKRHSQGHKVISANKDSCSNCPGVCDDARLFRLGLERIPCTGICCYDWTMARAEVILSRNRTRLEILESEAADKDRAAAEEEDGAADIDVEDVAVAVAAAAAAAADVTLVDEEEGEGEDEEEDEAPWLLPTDVADVTLDACEDVDKEGEDDEDEASWFLPTDVADVTLFDEANDDNEGEGEDEEGEGEDDEEEAPWLSIVHVEREVLDGKFVKMRCENEG